MKQPNLTQIEKGKIALEILDNYERISTTVLLDKFFYETYCQITAKTLETYVLAYLDSLPLEEQITYLNKIALKGIFPTFNAAKLLCISSLSEKDFCKLHSIDEKTYKRAEKYVASIEAYEKIKQKISDTTRTSGSCKSRLFRPYLSYGKYVI